MKHLCFFNKTLSSKVPKWIYDLVLPVHYFLRHPSSFSAFLCRSEYFKNIFLCVRNDWNKFKPKICNFTSYASFRNVLINFVRLSENELLNMYDQVDIKLLTRLWLGFSCLRKNKIKHNSEDDLNPLCSCSI